MQKDYKYKSENLLSRDLFCGDLGMFRIGKRHLHTIGVSCDKGDKTAADILGRHQWALA